MISRSVFRLSQRRAASKATSSAVIRSTFTPQLRGLASLGDLQQQQRNYSSKSARVTSNDGNFRDQFFKANGILEGSKFARFKSTTSLDKEDEKDYKAVTKSKGNPFLLDMGIPKLIPEWKKMFSKETLFQDISAGLAVGTIAIPLNLAIAVASGVPAEVGLVTAAVSGVAGGLMGGTTLAVTGPAAAISLLVVGAVQQHGLEALPFITLACGGMQLASGVTRLGVFAKLVPVSVIAGFTTGVGTLILTGQIPKALGMSMPAGLNPVQVLGFVGENISQMNPSSAALAFGTSAAMYLLPKVHPKMPAALMAVGGATMATHTLGLDVSVIGNIPSGLDAFQFGIPSLPSAGSMPSLAATTFLIYSMTSVESLLSCAALEKMKKTGYQHDADQELVGQGLANMGAAFFMGMPVTSVIARSGLNVRLNAATRLPAIIQASFVFGSVVFFSDKIATIPMPALSGMLITTGMGMLYPAEFKDCYAVKKMDALPFVTTIGGMVSMGLAEGIGIGCATALALNYQQTAMTSGSATMVSATPVTSVHASGVASDSTSFTDSTGEKFLFDSSKSTVYEMEGPINFVSMFAIDNMIRELEESLSSAQSKGEQSVVVDMEKVTDLEFTGMEELVMRLTQVSHKFDSIDVQMVNCSDPVLQAMDQCDPKQEIRRFSQLRA